MTMYNLSYLFNDIVLLFIQKSDMNRKQCPRCHASYSLSRGLKIHMGYCKIDRSKLKSTGNDNSSDLEINKHPLQLISTDVFWSSKHAYNHGDYLTDAGHTDTGHDYYSACWYVVTRWDPSTLDPTCGVSNNRESSGGSICFCQNGSISESYSVTGSIAQTALMKKEDGNS